MLELDYCGIRYESLQVVAASSSNFEALEKLYRAPRRPHQTRQSMQ